MLEKYIHTHTHTKKERKTRKQKQKTFQHQVKNHSLSVRLINTASYFPFTTRPLQGTLDQSGSSQKIKIRQ